MDTIHLTASADALQFRAAQLLEAGRFNAARPILAAVQAMGPPSPELTLIAARIALGSGAWAEALGELDSGIADAPSHAGLRKCRADLRQRMRDHDGAARDAAEAVIFDPADPEAKAILGATLLDLGRIVEAVACLTEAVTSAPSGWAYREALARALERTGDSDAALRVLTVGIAMSPTSLPMRNAAILLCIRRRDFNQAAQLAEQARASGVADACTFGMKGHALSSLGDHDQAVAAYQEALKLAPEDPYVRHLVVSATTMPGSSRAPAEYIRTVFDGYADRFESHLISLRYGIPVAIRSILLNHPRIASGLSLGPVLDLGCGTGLVALAVGDLPIESFTGVDLSPRMLAHAKAKRLYAELREGDIMADLTAHPQQWSLIVAADVLCYFGALEELLPLVHQRLEPNGWFVFSVEQMLADHDGVVPGNGNWALQRQGRYAHTEQYVYEAVCAAGFRTLRMDRPAIRQEAGTDVRGLLFAVERLSMTVDVDQLPVGVDLLVEGRFKDALVPLRLALSLGETDPATILNLAIAEDRAGDRERGRRLMHQVAIRLPEWDEPILRLAESLRAVGEGAAAEEAYRKVLDLNPQRQEALIALAGLLLMRGEAQPARDLLLQCCGVAPDNAEAWNTLGLALRETGVFGLALSAFVKAQRLQPNQVDYVLNGVEVTLNANEGDAELARLSVACEQTPLNPALHIGCGVLLDRLGRKAEAIDALEVATHLAPDALVPLRMLGEVLSHSGRVSDAEKVLRRLAALDPENRYSGNNHAAILMRMYRFGEAREILLAILDRYGPNSNELSNLANTTACLGDQDEALKLARWAIELDPAAVLPRRALCTVLPYCDGTTGAQLLSAVRDCSAVIPCTPRPECETRPEPNRPLIVGLLSGSLRSHPVGWLTIAGFEALDPDQFSLVCLTQNSFPQDPIARRFRNAARDWIEIDALSDSALTNLARAKGIDILIDLGGYGDATRMLACANRLAPVQIKWVGMQSHSSGLAEMDWFLTDRWETPDGFERFYSEKLLRLPDGYVCYSAPPHAPDVAESPALANEFITFGCFNNLAKITPRVMETWARVLRRVPTARMILKTHQLSHVPTADRFRATFAALGVAGNRIELRGSSGHRAFMGEYGDVDIVLDPFPYSGGLTTCEALWMGVPTITLPGEIFASRHSASHLSNAGLADWVTDSVDHYVEMAVDRASDPAALAGMRSSLREQVRRSPLCDQPRFGRSLGVALRKTWLAWCASAEPGRQTVCGRRP